MRVVGGSHRGRRLAAPEGRWLRPTADRAREAVFNILSHRDGVAIAGATVLDAFAGTGAMGIEALSRGAARADFIDIDRRAIDVCRANLETLGEQGKATLHHADCLTPPRAAQPCDLVFLDPPYGEDLLAAALAALHAGGWIGPQTLCVAETASKQPFDPPDGFDVVGDRRYGAARILLLRLQVRG